MRLVSRQSTDALAGLSGSAYIPRPSPQPEFAVCCVRLVTRVGRLMRRVLLSLLTLGVSATGSFALSDSDSSIEFMSPSPLRPTIQPQTGNLAEAEPLPRRAPTTLPAIHVFLGMPDGSAIGGGLADIGAPLRVSLPGAAADPGPAPAYLEVPAAWTKEVDKILRRDAGGNLAAEYQYLQAIVRLPGLIGVSAAYDRMRKMDPENWRLKDYWNFRSGWELDYAPSSATMFYLRSFYSTNYQSTFAEIKPGFAAFENFPFGKIYVGPFAILNGLRRDQASKLGAHLTLSEIGAFHVTVACGLTHDRLLGSGAFGMIESSLRF